MTKHPTSTNRVAVIRSRGPVLMAFFPLEHKWTLINSEKRGPKAILAGIMPSGGALRDIISRTKQATSKEEDAVRRRLGVDFVRYFRFPRKGR